MIKRMIFQKKEFINEISKSLSCKPQDVCFGYIEKNIELENIIIDTIEIKCESLDSDIFHNVNKITDFYKFDENKIIIELTDLKNYISNLYQIEVAEIYDFFECNIFGYMEECISFEMI